MNQEVCAFAIVGLAVLAAIFHFYRGYLAKPLSQYFLKTGRVKLAMKMRTQVEESGCGNCGKDSTSGPSCH